MSQIYMITSMTFDDVARCPDMRHVTRNIVDIVAPAMDENKRHALAVHLNEEISVRRVNLLSPAVLMEPIDSRYSWVVSVLPIGVSLAAIRACQELITQMGTVLTLTPQILTTLAAYIEEDQIIIDERTMGLARRLINHMVFVNGKLGERTDGIGLMIKNVGTVQDVWVLFAHYAN